MSAFRDRYGGRLAQPAQRSAYLRGMVAAKVKAAAEDEIQRILGEVEARLRAAIDTDFIVQVGALQHEFNTLSAEDKIVVHVHMVSTKATKDAATISITDPKKLLK
jgi:hypothetical protein